MPASEATRPIVIGDAEPEARAHLAAALRQDGYEVLEAENGLEALLYVKRVRPAAVIVTLDLPRVAGLEVLRRVRLFDSSIRVVIVGAAARAASAEALAAGAVAVLQKPVQARDVLAALSGPPRPRRRRRPPARRKPRPCAVAS